METVTTSDARKKLADLLNLAIYKDQTTVITRHGKPVAMIAPASDDVRKKVGSVRAAQKKQGRA